MITAISIFLIVFLFFYDYLSVEWYLDTSVQVTHTIRLLN
jgi:hypothetical protein